MIIKRNPAPKAYLALLGDKHLLANETGTAFLMYGTSVNSWIALGDPVGPSETAVDLIKRFVSASRMQGAQPVFHEVGLDHLTIYADLGLSSIHIADMARVRVASFGLQGSANRSLRNHIRGAGRHCSFDLFSRPVRDNILAELGTVSDEWLATRRTREKRFSMGCFDSNRRGSARQIARRLRDNLVRQGRIVH
jgi:phosphatidylglycerol lysyltransferase